MSWRFPFTFYAYINVSNFFLLEDKACELYEIFKSLIDNKNIT